MAKDTTAKKVASTTPAKPAKVPVMKKSAASKPAPAKKAAAADAPAAKNTLAPKAKAAGEVKEKVKKVKLVRDSFTMPEPEYAVLGEVKKVCLKAGIEVKKSELLRIGVALIRKLDTAQVKEILASLPALKAGRPKKSK